MISPTVNFHYSTSYLFSWGPFNHTGLRADFNFGEGWVGKLAIMNPTDIVEFNPVNTYTAGLFQVGKTTDAGGIWLNFLYGDQTGKLDEDIDNIGLIFPQVHYSRRTLQRAGIFLNLFYLGANASYQMVKVKEKQSTTVETLWTQVTTIRHSLVLHFIESHTERKLRPWFESGIFQHDKQSHLGFLMEDQSSIPILMVMAMSLGSRSLETTKLEDSLLFLRSELT